MGKFSSDCYPFRGFEIVVLKKKEERGGAQQRSVLAMELGFAVFGRFVGGRLGYWVAEVGGKRGCQSRSMSGGGRIFEDSEGVWISLGDSS